VGRLCVIFCLLQIVDCNSFLGPAPAEWPTEPMAYIMWFTHFKPSPHDDTGMYCVEPAKDSKGLDQGYIILLTDIWQTCMLAPGKTIWDKTWDSQNILDRCDSFFINNLESKYSYQMIY
jgi:hypothetical protein